MAFLAGVAGWTSRSRRTDLARSAITAGGSGRAGGPRMTGRAGGTWVNRDFQDVVQSQTNVLVNRSPRLNGAHGGNGNGRRRAYCDNFFRHKFSVAFVFAGLLSHSPCLLNDRMLATSAVKGFAVTVRRQIHVRTPRFTRV